MSRVEVIGNATLYLGDALVIAPTLADIRAVVCDPPYGIAYKHSGKTGAGRKAQGSGRVGVIQGDDKPFDPEPWLGYEHVLFWGANHFSHRLPQGRWFAWDKHCGVGPNVSFSPVEFAWTKGRGRNDIHRQLWIGLCRGKYTGDTRFHVMEKPVELMHRSIEWAGVPAGSIILDPYMGGGSTAVAALAMGYSFVGVEIDPIHFETACERLYQCQRQGSLFTEAAA